MTDPVRDIGAFAAAFEYFLHAMTAAAERGESPLVARLRAHLGTDPQALPSTAAEFSTPDHPNLQLALDAVFPDAEIIGYTAPHMGFAYLGLSELLAGFGPIGPIRQGPVQYTDIEVGTAALCSASPRGSISCTTARRRSPWCSREGRRRGAAAR